jgi:hypothetical protein
MSWYNKDFKRRVPFLIDCSSTSAGAIDFTVTIPTEYDDFWSNTRSDGFDVVITDYTGQQLAFQRLTWTPATPRGIFQVSGYTLPASNTMLVGYVYWDNPDQSSDLSTSVSVSSAKLGQIYLGAPFGNVINLQSRSGLSTVPTTIVQKDVDEKIDIFFPVSQLLAPRSLPYNERLDFKSIRYIDVQVLNSSGVNQASMYALEETRLIAGFCRVRVQAGVTNTDFVVRALIYSSDSEVFILSCLLQVRQLLPS